MSQENAKLVLDVISVIEHRDPQRSRSAATVCATCSIHVRQADLTRVVVTPPHSRCLDCQCGSALLPSISFAHDGGRTRRSPDNGRAPRHAPGTCSYNSAEEDVGSRLCLADRELDKLAAFAMDPTSDP